MLLFSGQQVSEELGDECQSHGLVYFKYVPNKFTPGSYGNNAGVDRNEGEQRMGENSIYCKDVDKGDQNSRKQMSHLKSKLSVLQEFYYRRGFLNFNLN